MKQWIKQHAVHLAISVISLVLAGLHAFLPSVQVDLISLTLFAIAVLPWLGSIFRSVELPGGLKVEYQDLREAEEKATEAGLLERKERREKVEPVYSAIAGEDPNLALAGLRIEIEGRLRQIAESHDVDANRKGLGQLMRQLQVMGILSQQQITVLRDLLGLLNNAVHGADVDPRSAKWALEVGPELIAGLEVRVSDSLKLGDKFRAEIRKSEK